MAPEASGEQWGVGDPGAVVTDVDRGAGPYAAFDAFHPPSADRVADCARRAWPGAFAFGALVDDLRAAAGLLSG